jgi:hypothetical protein
MSISIRKMLYPLIATCYYLLLCLKPGSSSNVEDKFITKVLLSINDTVYQIDNQYARRYLQTEEDPEAAASHSNLTSSVDMSKQTAEEANYLEYHRCFDEGEAYAAAYLITKEHLMNHKIDHDLASANTELASFIFFDNAKSTDIRHGTITMALDVFDYSVIHLSAYERLIRRHRVQEHPPFAAIEASTKDLIATLPFWKQNPFYKVNERRFNSTVAIMPWLGKEVGVGNSHVENRNSYLHSCFWSLYAVIPNIVVGVSNVQDFDFLRSV